MKHHINIEYKKISFKLFLLGYSSDGGFFVKDLINDGNKYMVTKMLIPSAHTRKFGKFTVPMKKCENWIVKKSPKLTHHIDGTVHVSGEGIMSGSYKFFRGYKGVCTQSMDLKKRNNDGGPIFIFHTKNLVESKTKGGITIRQRDQIIDYYNKPKNEDDCSFTLEFFYFSKEMVMKNLDLSTGTFPFKHINYGIVPLKFIPAPDNSPGVIGILTIISTKFGSDGNFSFSINGGATATLKNGEEEHICIIYPHNEKMADKKTLKTLDFVNVNKIKVFIDSLFYRLIRIFK